MREKLGADKLETIGGNWNRGKMNRGIYSEGQKGGVSKGILTIRQILGKRGATGTLGL